MSEDVKTFFFWSSPIFIVETSKQEIAPPPPFFKFLATPLKYLVLRYGTLFFKTSSNILRIEISKIRTNIILLVITNSVFGMILPLLQLTLQHCDYTANF